MLTPDPSAPKTGSGTADKIKKDAGAAVSSAKAAVEDATNEVREEIGATEPTGARVVAENARKIKQDLGAAGSEAGESRAVTCGGKAYGETCPGREGGRGSGSSQGRGQEAQGAEGGAQGQGG